LISLLDQSSEFVDEAKNGICMFEKPMKHFLLFFLFCIGCSDFFSQTSSSTHTPIVVAFWNVENLYDTLNDEYKNDEDFTSEGVYHWTGERYRRKLDHLSDIISQLGIHLNEDGPAIMGFCEVENKQVMLDLVQCSTLVSRNYKVVHIEGPDVRGIDPAFIYQSSYFDLIRARTFPVRMITDSLYLTRQILMVYGKLQDRKTAIFINHWPSRRGGEKRSQPNRNEAARVLRQITDSIARLEPDTRIIVMGDLNDDPIDESVKKILGTCDKIEFCDQNFFNPMEHLYKQGIGSLAYQDSWNLFDQILFSSKSFTDGSSKFVDAWVYNKVALRNSSGKYKGYPIRTFSGTNYTGGYSDHFPVYAALFIR